MKTRAYSGAVAILTGAFAMGANAAAVAVDTGTDADKSAPTLDEVIVSATRRDEALKDVPISIAVYSEKNIEQANITRPTDFVNLTANVAIASEVAPGESDVSIRGIQGNFGLQQPVALVIDGVVTPNQNALDQELYDIVRIEVAKGPQGALYGRNADAGAIIIETKRPTNDLEMKVTGGVGNGGSGKGQAAVSGALIPDRLLARVDFSYTNREGYWYDFAVGHPADFKKELIGSARFIYEATDDLTFDLRVRKSEVDAGGQYFTPELYIVGVQANNNSYFPAIQQNNNQPQVQHRLDTALKVDDDLHFATLTGVLSYATYTLEEFADGPINPLDFTDPAALAAANPPIAPGYSYTTLDGNAWGYTNRVDKTAELRLTSPSVQRLRWMMGAFWGSEWTTDAQTSHDDVDGVVIPGVYSAALAANAANPATGGREDRNAWEDYAGFAQLQYDLTPRLEASLAARYDTEKHDNENLLLVPVSPYAGVVRYATFDAFQPKLSLLYKITDHASIFASAGRGFRSGGFNNAGSTAAIHAKDGYPDFPDADSFRAETSNAYELGVKGSFLDARLFASAAVFYTDIHDAQSFTAFPISITTVTLNLTKVRSQGAELEASYKLLDGLRVFESFGLTDARIREAIIPDAIGKRVPLTPEYTNSLGLDFNHSAGHGLQFDGHVGWRLTGRTWFDVYNTPDTQRNPFSLVDARLALQGERNADVWQVALWSKNLLNKYYDEYASPDGIYGNFAYRGEPRQYGVDVTYKF
ncbi:MAG TPA: TonB-dependent receptor [Steroidobacteraceae bacterium]|nr:TonB-dependent receptor [Steroidobacteraceae bacterium]